MKVTYKFLLIILVISIIGSAMVGCEKEEEPTYADYSVTIVDGMGNPMPNVMVKFTYPDGETTKTRVTGIDGVATLKNVETGKYDIILEKGFSNASFDVFNFELTKDVTNLTVIVRDDTKTADIYGEIGEGAFAYNIGVGSYDIPCAENYDVYFVFYAQNAGTYNVTLTSDDSDATVGYYGIPQYVQLTHRGDGEYDGRSFELIIQDPSTPYVIGVHTAKKGSAELVIERTGDAPFDPQFAPWTVVEAEHNITKCDLPEGSVLTDLSVTNKNLSVELREDGYYYTNDGKLVYLRINSISDRAYLDVSIAFIAGLVDPNFGQNFGGYVYDSEGNFVDKYSYNEMLAEYYENLDSTGVYPLTAELAEAIKVHGNSTGWWNPNAANYLFAEVNEVEENAWLFLCCTVD
ncbi:MAG: Ig-like domain-containing protein [Clostridia bacterium]|nr:Ig-like domain-containing protein [Clostridia bacterium]